MGSSIFSQGLFVNISSNGASKSRDKSKRSLKTRSLRAEPLEERQLLSATPYETGSELVEAPIVAEAFVAEDDAIDLSSLSETETPLITEAATTFTVTSTSDSATTSGTLRYALANAKAGDKIKFDASLKGKTISLSGSELSVTKAITIDASSIWNSATDAPGITISGNSSTRVMTLAANATLVGLKITGGRAVKGAGLYVNSGVVATIDKCVITNNRAYLSEGSELAGAGVYSLGNLTITNSKINGNTTSVSLSQFISLYGRGIFSSGSLTMVDSEVCDNKGQVRTNDADYDIRGAGIYSTGELNLTRCAIKGNITNGYRYDYNNSNPGLTFKALGGGIYMTGTANLTECVVSDNVSGDGGAFYIASGTVTAVNCSIRNNSVGYHNNTNFNYSTHGYGGGICNAGTLTFINGEIVGNTTCPSADASTAFGYGGGIYSTGTFKLWNATVAGNNATTSALSGSAAYGGGIYVAGGSGTLYNSIVVGNTADTSGAEVQKSSGTLNAYYSLSSYTSWGGSGNKTYASSKPLFVDAENGDYSLAANSQAIDKGYNSYAKTSVDLAGNARIYNGTVDLGAYEYAPAQTALDAPTASTTPLETQFVVKIGEVDNASNYLLEYGLNSNYSGATQKNYSTSGAKTISGLTARTKYYCRVKAQGAGYEDSAWTTFTVTTNNPSDNKLATPTLSVSSKTANSVTLAIGSVANATNYTIQYTTSSSFSSSTLKTYSTSGNTTITGLTPATTYYFRVKATASGYTESNWSSLVSATTNLATPTLTKGTVTSNSIAVTIGAVDKAGSYTLEYATNSSFTSGKGSKTYTTAGTKTIDGLSPGTDYYFRVMATATGYDGSAWSATLKATTLDDETETLAKPTLTKGAVTSSTVKVTIGSVTNATKYTLQYSTSSSFATKTEKTYTSAGTKTIDGLSASTTYYFRVKASATGYNDSAWSSTVTAKTPAPNLESLAKPVISLSGTHSAVVVKIDPVDGAEKYVLDYSTDSAFSTYTEKTYTSSGTKTISGLNRHETYYVRVKATATDRADSAFATGSVYTCTDICPMPAISFDAVKTAIVVKINEVEFADKYVLEYSENEDFSDAKTKTYTTPGAKTISGLTFGTKYYIRVKATSSVANPSRWNEGSYRAGQLRTPAHTFTTIGSDSVKVKCWNSPNASGFEVRYSTSADFSNARTAQGPSSGVVEITGLSANTKYYFSARALGDDVSRVESNWTPSFSATTKATSTALAAPTASTTVYSDKIVVKIGEVANAAGYALQYATNSSFTSATTKTYSSAGVKTLTGLNSATTYYFRVKATSTAYGESAWNSFSAKTKGAVPTVGLSVTKTAVVLNISGVENFSSVEVQYATNSSFTNATSKTFTTLGAKTFSGLTSGKTYYFRVRANYSDGPSDWVVVQATTKTGAAKSGAIFDQESAFEDYFADELDDDLAAVLGVR